jgi:hypothetical protein
MKNELRQVAPLEHVIHPKKHIAIFKNRWVNKLKCLENNILLFYHYGL